MGERFKSLEKAILVAMEVHAGQLDKSGQPYILHPLRVMLAGETEQQQIVGALHDVLEDGKWWTAEKLTKAGFSGEIVTAVQAVSRLPGETYEAFVLRAKRDPIGRWVKLADLRDNLRPSGLDGTPDHDARRAKYERAVAVLASGPTP